MLEVHPPDHPPHSAREFGIHLFTITIGLFIALSLENAAEWVHHRHQRNEADANIVSEIHDNQREVSEMLSAIPTEEKNLKKVLEFLQAHAAGRPYDLTSMSLGLTLGSLQDASWKTATATGAVSYMEYSHVKSYSAAYTLQDEFGSLQERTLDAYLRLQAYIVGGFDPDKMTPADADRARLDVQQTMARLEAMQQIGIVLKRTYDGALQPR